MTDPTVTPAQLRESAALFRADGARAACSFKGCDTCLRYALRYALAAAVLEAQADALEARASDRRRTAEQAIDDALILADLGTLAGAFQGDARRALNALLAHAQASAIYASGRREVCEWRYDDPDRNLWESECGLTWQFNAGTLDENGVRFCHQCGGLVREYYPTPPVLPEAGE
jgi:hypothetical protein